MTIAHVVVVKNIKSVALNATLVAIRQGMSIAPLRLTSKTILTKSYKQSIYLLYIVNLKYTIYKQLQKTNLR